MATPAFAATVPDPSDALSVSQAAIGNQIGDHVFRDTERRRVSLAAFRGRPLVVNLVYTGCSNACPVVIQTLYDAVEAAQDAVGEDSFRVATIGFDAAHDTPERMRAFARQQGVDLANWTFLSGDRATVEQLADEVGFVVTPSAGGFDHMAQTTIVDPEGAVYRQVYGGGFEVPAVVEPLKELVFGRETDWTSAEGLLNRIQLVCTVFDPKSGRYRFDYSVFLGAAIGLVCLGGVALHPPTAQEHL